MGGPLGKHQVWWRGSGGRPSGVSSMPRSWPSPSRGCAVRATTHTLTTVPLTGFVLVVDELVRGGPQGVGGWSWGER